MPKHKAPGPGKKSGSPTSSHDADVSDLTYQWRSWRTDLKQYWTQIDKNQEMYEFYKREASETSSDVSLNMPFAIVESMVSRLNDSSLKVTARAHGGLPQLPGLESDALDELEDYVEGLLYDAIEDPRVEVQVGPFRKVKEVFARDLFVKGNAAAEINYCYRTTVDAKGNKKVVADNPFVRNLPMKSVVFDPSKTFMTSDRYYIEKHVKFSDLENSEKSPETGKGIYTNLASLKSHLTQETQLRDAEDDQFVTGDLRLQRRVGPIHLLEVHDGPRIRVIANRTTLIRDDYDPFHLGSHPLLLGMNYVIEGRPYAYGEVDAIYKPVRAQDTVVNQKIEAINKYLRGTVLVDPSSQMDLDMVITIMENGGVGYGDPKAVGEIAKTLPPGQAFQQTEELQQAIERTARFSPYTSGTAQSADDKTQGTKGGIIALQNAAEPNFQVKLDALKDMFLRPLARKYLRMIGGLMGTDDTRFALLRGEDPKWITVTKGILMGSATLQDLMTAGMVSQQQVQQLTTTTQTDPMTGQASQVPIKGASKALVFETDWLIDVDLDTKSASDRQAQGQNLMSVIQFGLSLGAQFSPERVVEAVGRKMGFDEVTELFLTDQEKQQMAQGQQKPVSDPPRFNFDANLLPPEVQSQVLAQGGIQAPPAQLAQHQIDGKIQDQAMKMQDQAANYKPVPPPQPKAVAGKR